MVDALNDFICKQTKHRAMSNFSVKSSTILTHNQPKHKWENVQMLFNALIRTHHITSRKKVSALKRAADTHNCFVLLRSGGCPGIMYVESQGKEDVESWVNEVRNLRYKDFQLVTRPDVLTDEKSHEREIPREKKKKKDETAKAGLSEVETVKEFGSLMEQRGIWNWWRKGMGYAS